MNKAFSVLMPGKTFFTIPAHLQVKEKRKIPLRYVVSDTVAVLRSAGLLLVLNIAAIVMFLCLSQGRDILLIIVERIGALRSKGSSPIDSLLGLASLLVTIMIWSVLAEFSTRYAIYVTDNSAKSISEERVVFRKRLQRIITKAFFTLPYIIIYIGLTQVCFNAELPGNEKAIGAIVVFVSVYLCWANVSKIYAPQSGSKTRFPNLPPQEASMTDKLYGIYNEFVYSLPRTENFDGNTQTLYEAFSNQFKNNHEQFPQSEALSIDKRVPKEFTLIKYSVEDQAGGAHKWVYKIPLSYYKTLHKQLAVIAGICFVIYIVLCFPPVKWYPLIGAAGLVCFAFASWSAMHIGMMYLDHGLFRNKTFSIRGLLLILLITVSWLNHDHPVNYISEKSDYSSRTELNNFFKTWINNYKSTTGNFFEVLKQDKAGQPYKDSCYPVIFVCAEGGALRTGAFTTLTLSYLQDSIKKLAGHNYDFKKAICIFSSVSGGSVGVGFFNAAAYYSDSKDDAVSDRLTMLSKQFFSEDYLSPILGKMLYGDFVNLFIPGHILCFDRAIALETSWQEGYATIKKDIFTQPYIHFSADSLHPAWFINTTEIESGLQCWISNVKIDTCEHIINSKERDVLAEKLNVNIRYSTAINFSSRFPGFSPAAELDIDSTKKHRRHYIDGGYVENTGAGTMFELLQSLQEEIKKNKVKPFVIALRFSADDTTNSKDSSKWNGVRFGNELNEILLGIYNTREGRTSNALKQLERYTEKELGGTFINVPLKLADKKVPMNWVLSKTSIENVEEYVRQNIIDSTGLKYLFYFDPRYRQIR